MFFLDTFVMLVYCNPVRPLYEAKEAWKVFRFMKIKLIDIPDTGLTVSTILEPMDIDMLDKNIEISENTHFRGLLKKSQAGCLITGHIDSKLKLKCSRCLEPTMKTINTDFRIFLSNCLNNENDKIIELDSKDLDESELIDGEINIYNVVREQLILQIPMKPLCSKACKGLCPVCGKDLNKKQCECEKTPIDPRLMKLKEFFKK